MYLHMLTGCAAPEATQLRLAHLSYLLQQLLSAYAYINRLARRSIMSRIRRLPIQGL